MNIKNIIQSSKRNDKIVLLAKIKSNLVKDLITKALIDSYINHDEFVLANNVLREYNIMKEEIKNSENALQYFI